MSEPLRPELHAQLAICFGDVLVANEGQELVDEITTQWRVRRRHSKAVRRLEVTQRGETYRVNCPFCGDDRHRLWVNHRWGLFDIGTNRRNLWLAKCFNEDCLKPKGRPQQLWTMVFGPTTRPPNDRLRPGRAATRPPITLPDDFVKLRSEEHTPELQ